MHEAENIERIIAEEAKEKQKRKPADFVRPTLDEQKPMRTDAAVAESVGMKRSTHRKVKDVYDTAKDETQPAPIRELAKQQMAALDTGRVLSCALVSG